MRRRAEQFGEADRDGRSGVRARHAVLRRGGAVRGVPRAHGRAAAARQRSVPDTVLQGECWIELFFLF